MRNERLSRREKFSERMGDMLGVFKYLRTTKRTKPIDDLIWIGRAYEELDYISKAIQLCREDVNSREFKVTTQDVENMSKILESRDNLSIALKSGIEHIINNKSVYRVDITKIYIEKLQKIYLESGLTHNIQFSSAVSIIIGLSGSKKKKRRNRISNKSAGRSPGEFTVLTSELLSMQRERAATLEKRVCTEEFKSAFSNKSSQPRSDFRRFRN
ncbi:hypothetical protein [Deinococcus alpinitundrae]|uniref:hypothetical protein n=1 Tax=Deinococcus alpinitundrae TaxID=468913 RepID=UPI001379EB7A|nr:hypothetical protein [Deinococcus alpinitundrae]